MVKGNLANGDYFIDCDSISLSALRAIFGVWISVCVAIIAFSIRSTYRSSLVTQLLGPDHINRHVSLWRVSPATTTAEAFQLRNRISSSFIKGDISYFIASLVCVCASVVTAAGTTIANEAVVENIVIRDVSVPGRLTTREHNTLAGFVVNVTARAQALDRANAPLDQVTSMPTLIKDVAQCEVLIVV